MNRTEACNILNLTHSEVNDITAIKTAYRKLSRIHHPDKGGNSSKMATINEAYTILLEKTVELPPITGNAFGLFNDLFNFMLVGYLFTFSRYSFPNINHHK